MPMNELLYIDTTQTQRYIFGSNRLMENIGGSYLVAQATNQWVLQTVFEQFAHHNVRNGKKADVAEKQLYTIDPDKCFDDHELEIEVLVASGGNSILIGRSSRHIDTFLQHYSRRLLLEAPNIPVYHARLAFKWTDGDLQAKVGQLTGEVADKAKRMHRHSEAVLGLSVTLPCKATGLPAVKMSTPVGDDNVSYPISAEIAAKHAVADHDRDENESSCAKAYLQEEVPVDESIYRYPGDFDDMVPRLGEANYIAIVHADGDGVGERLKQLGQGENWDNRQYVTERRNFSSGLTKATQGALRATLKSLLDKTDVDSDPNKAERVLRWWYGDEEMLVELKPTKKRGVYYLPFRPIISGGDDITFVCDGRIGLALALNYINAFKQATQHFLKQPISASTGVSIVKTHYPFARAYGLAEALMENAKNTRRYKDIRWDEANIGAIDWHFTVGGLYGSLNEIRRREYETGTQKLILRPVAVEKPAMSADRSWQVVNAGIEQFQEPKIPQESREWSTRRNKVKALRDALRNGPEAVKQFQTMYLDGKPLPDIGYPDFRNDGFYSKRCGYFDALELCDWYMPVSPISSVSLGEVLKNV